MTDGDNAHIADCSQNNLPGAKSYNGTLCCTVSELCYDGKDNDGDGLVDCADPECHAGTTTGPKLDPFGNTEPQVCHPNTCPATLHEGIQGFWQFENTTEDASGNANDGSVSGAAYTNQINGKLGQALDFNPGNQVTVPDDKSFYETLDPSSAITLSAYLNPDGSDGDIVDKDSYELYLSGGDLYFELNSGSIITLNIGSIPQGEWTHVAATYNQSSGEATGYIDGSQVASNTGLTGSIPNSNQDLLIGSDGSNNYDGRIDQVRVYSRELTSSEVSSFTNSQCQNRQRTIECVNNPELCETNYTSENNYHCNYGQFDDPQQQATGVCCPRDEVAAKVGGSWGCYARDACGLNTAAGEECAYNISANEDAFFNDTRKNSSDDHWCQEQIPRTYDNPDQPSPAKSSACCYVPKQGKLDYWFKDGNVKVYG
ncbi:LamG-like jellyroll fold domain-containing protein [Salinibacter sp.]|uniref:LamG-like jellyroll fold domain-containing protein n=1 Tax=Salinibacter sp. TaxID=2065818 RepID=UPI0021E80DED|nr:LamG domain-containing protein [Salinibacter sp.]